MANTTLDDVQTKLAYLLGEQSAPSTTAGDYASRTSFIQSALERAYRAYDFPFNKLVATVQLSSGAATLPSSVIQDSEMDVRVLNSGVNDDLIFKAINYEEQDKYTTGDYVYWITGYEGTGTYYINTSEKNSAATLTIRYSSKTPVLNASIATPFPSSMALARGALIYYRQAEDPQADLSQEEALFQAEIEDIIAAYNRARPQPRMISRHEAGNSYIGDLGYID